MKITHATPVETQLEELGRRIACERSQRGYSQEGLAAQAGIGVATLRRLETGSDSQFSSWLKVLSALRMTDHLTLLLPEPLRSPRMDALQAKSRKGRGEGRAKLSAVNVSGSGGKSSPAKKRPGPRKVSWGDEKP